MANSSDRESRLNSLRLKVGRELEDDIRKEGPNLKQWLILNFEREILLAETFALREDPVETVYHRALAEMTHRTLNDLESAVVS